MKKKSLSPATPPGEALLEVNLMRAWWILIITTLFTVLFTISGRITGTSEEFATVQIVDYTLSSVFFFLFLAARWGRCPVRLRRILPLAYALFFVLINDGYYFSAWPVAGDNVGYAFGVLTPAALLYLRPSIFAPFLMINHVFVFAMVIRQPAAFESMVSALYGTTITMLIAVVSSIIQYRTKIAELEKTAIIARRNLELAASNSSLLAMSQKMDEMMALAAHDLRSPLLSLASLCEIEQTKPEWQGQDQERTLDVIRDGANRMAALVNTMLTEYAARHDSLEGLSLETCDLVPIFQEAAAQAHPLARRKNIAIDTHNFPAQAMTEANADALGRIFGNLLSNAIKYSPENTRVELRIERNGPRWVCEVKDEGPGIPLQERPSLFNKLQRGKNLPTSGEDSTGLGLYSARKLVESMDGDIEYEAAPVRGSIFRILLYAA